ncbi:MAG: GNAT family N-acetyltransferase [Verrucomicrobiales bacterium]
MEFQVIDHDSASYRETVALRDRVLRAPIGLSVTEGDLKGEAAEVHIAGRDKEGGLVSCAIVRLEESGDPGEAPWIRLRQMAVIGHRRREGIGRALLEFAEDHARSHLGATRIYCHVRRRALPFYEKLGYLPVGEPFEEVGLPHMRMEKEL